MSRRARDRVLAAFGIVTALVFLAKATAPSAAIFQELLQANRLLRLGAVAKLVFLLVAWRFAVRASTCLEPGNPARTPFRLLALGLAGFGTGQAVLSGYQILTATNPYPSPGDFFFLMGYPPLIAGAFGFIRAYRESGYPVGSLRQHGTLALCAGLAFVVLGVALLGPILRGPGPLGERLLTSSYPALDFVLLIPILVLARITASFRGGRIFNAWATLLGGIALLCLGDILYAYLVVMRKEGLDPLVDAAYVLAYLLLARGTSAHHELLTG